MLARNPGFTAIAVLALALGIGANSAIFSFTNAYLLRPIPYQDSERLRFVRNLQIPAQRVIRNPTYGELLAWRESSHTVDKLVGSRYLSFNVTETHPPEQLLGMQVSAGFFEVLGARPERGRTFNEQDDSPDGKRVAVLSYGLWQRMGAREDIIGHTLHLNGELHTVVGVMPASFQFPNPEWQIWVPLGFAADQAGRQQWVNVLFKLKPGASAQAAAAELGEVARRIDRSDSAGSGLWRIETSSLYEQLNHVPQAKPSILILTAAAAFVLLIACANLANLLLARATVRRREIAIRRAVGAGQGQVVRQMLVEASVLSICGGALGMLVAYVGVRALVAVCPTWILPVGGVGMDSNVLWFTVAVSLAAGVVFGLVPALQISRTGLAGEMKEGGRTGTGGRHWLRRILVVSEMSATVILLIGAGLLIRSLHGSNADLGFRPENLLTADISLPETKYVSNASVTEFFREVTENLSRTPGVVSAGAAGRFARAIVLADGRGAPTPGEEVRAITYAATPTYLSTLGVTLRSGRFFDERASERSQPVALVNESLAKRIWPGMDPIGRTIKFGQDDKLWKTVIGVFADARGNPLEVATPEAYVPHTQKPARMLQLVLRTQGDPSATAKALRAQVAAVDPHQAVSKVRTMEELMAFQIAPQRVTSGLLTVFAAVALLLAATGLYGVMAYSVSQRTHEFGVRVALGASRDQIARMVMREACVLAATGALIGLTGAFGLTRLMRAILFGVSATDPLTFLTVPVVLSLVVVAAACFPTFRAMQVDPIGTLRCD